MSARFFLDTNLFVYTFESPATAKSRTAAKLIREAIQTRKGVISYQVVQEFFNVAFRRFSLPMTSDEARRYLETVFRPLLTLHSSESLYIAAIRLCSEKRIAWYDALIVAAALEAECEVLYTEDLQHGAQFEHVRIRNPFLQP